MVARADERRRRNREYQREYRQHQKEAAQAGHEVPVRLQPSFRPDEYKELSRRAKAAGMTPTTYLKEVYRAAVMGRPVMDAVAAEALHRVEREIRKIGDNLNQLVKLAHLDASGERKFWQKRRFDPTAALRELHGLGVLIRKAAEGMEMAATEVNKEKGARQG